MTTISQSKKAEIQKEYQAIKSFNSKTLSDLAAKHGITLDELLKIIDL